MSKTFNWSFFKRKRSLLLIPLFLLLFVVWALGTNSGSRWVLNLAMSQLNGRIDNLRGTIWSGLKFSALQINMDSLNVAVKDADLKVDWPKLLKGTLSVDHMIVSELGVQLFPVTSPEDPDKKDEPIELPIDIEVDQLSLKTFSLMLANGEKLPVDLSNFDLRALKIRKSGTQAVLRNLQVDNQDLRAQLKGKLHLAQLGEPWPMHLTLSSNLTGLNTSSPVCIDSFSRRLAALPVPVTCRFDAGLAIQGDLNNLTVAIDGQGQGASLVGQSKLNLSSPLVLNSADFKLNHHRMSVAFKADSRSSSTQQTILSGSFRSRGIPLERITEGSALNADLNFEAVADARHQLERVALQGNLLSGSAWNHLPLDGAIDVALRLRDLQVPASSQHPAYSDFSKLILEKGDINLKIGDNAIQSRGSWGDADSRWKLDVALQDLSQLWPTLSRDKLKAQIDLQGNLADHRLGLDADYQPAAPLADSKSQPSGAAGGGAGKSKSDATLVKLNTDGKLNYEQGLIRWRGELESLHAAHGGIQLEQQNPLTINFEQGAVPTLNKLEIGAAAFGLNLPDGKGATIAHQHTVLDRNALQSQGSFSDLTISAELLQALGIKLNQPGGAQAGEPVRYSGAWSVQQNEGKMFVELNRHSGASMLPVRDFPLDFKHFSLQSQRSKEHPEHTTLTLSGEGDQSTLQGQLQLDSALLTAVRSGQINLQLSDRSSLQTRFSNEPVPNEPGFSRWQMVADTHHLNLAPLTLGAAPASKLDGSLELTANLLRDTEIKDLSTRLSMQPDSRWQGQPLQGHLNTDWDLNHVLPLPMAIESPLYPGQINLDRLRLRDADINLVLGSNTFKGSGQWGRPNDHFQLAADLPNLSQFAASLSGRAGLHLDLNGNLDQHQIKLDADYNPQKAASAAKLKLALDAGLARLREGGFDWHGTLSGVDASYGGMSLAIADALDAKVRAPQDDKLSWAVGQAQIKVGYPDGREAVIDHIASKGQGSQIASKGALDNLVLSKPLLDYFQQLGSSFSTEQSVRAPAKQPAERELVLKGDWDLQADQTVQGQVNIERKGASGPWPFDLPVPIDFDHLSLAVEPQAESRHPDEPRLDRSMTIKAEGSGPQSRLHAFVQFNPQNPVLADAARLYLSLPDKSLLSLFLKTQADDFTPEQVRQVFQYAAAARQSAGAEEEQKLLRGALQDTQTARSLSSLDNMNVLGGLYTRGFPLEKLSGGAVPPGHVDAYLAFDGSVRSKMLEHLHLDGSIDPSSRWNRSPLQGNVDLLVQRDAEASSRLSNIPSLYVLPRADLNLKLGENQIVSKGGFGQQRDRLQLNINAPRLSAFWPDLPGSIKSQLDLSGTLASHSLDAQLDFRQGSSTKIGKAPVQAQLSLQGGLQSLREGIEAWQGKVRKLKIDHAGFEVNQPGELSVMAAPAGADGQPEWKLGASNINVKLPGGYQFNIEQGGSEGGSGKWSSKGKIPDIVLSKQLFDTLDLLSKKESTQKTGATSKIVVNDRQQRNVDPTKLALNWDLAFDHQLKGSVNLKRVSGDVLIPATTPLPLGLRQFELNVVSRPAGGSSTLKAELAVDTAKRGSLHAEAETRLEGLSFDPRKQVISARVNGRISDIGWMSALTDDMLELGGDLNLDVAARIQGDSIRTQGGLKGKNLKIIEIENGIRLMNGSLDIGLEGERVRIRQFHFPSVLRVVPTEWRTRQWIRENPPAQNGSLDASGYWDLQNNGGQIKVRFDHYPVVQRSDRFVMVSGGVDVDAALPHIKVAGKAVADAGWASVDIQGGAPSLDSDVVIVDRSKEEEPKPSPMDLDLQFSVDLGPRFYIVGYGLDSGLKGGITVVQRDHRLTGVGAFQTRGGAVEAYGQRLQISRGKISFQGNLMNPLLDIEAVRRGLEVEAGVQVKGTARRPKIELISYPDVSEVEKLSWLIMGRGPDSNGGDLAMLFSVGSSIVGGGEPLYKKFGIDEVGIHTGDISKTSSVLPAKTVADSTMYAGAKDVENQFISVGKRLGKETWFNIEQALSGTGTIGKFSYRLSDYIRSNLKIGTNTGIEMRYDRSFKD